MRGGLFDRPVLNLDEGAVARTDILVQRLQRCPGFPWIPLDSPGGIPAYLSA